MVSDVRTILNRRCGMALLGWGGLGLELLPKRVRERETCAFRSFVAFLVYN